MVIFGDKSTGKYVEDQYDETEGRIIVKWVNYPSEIIYYDNVDNKDHYIIKHRWLREVLRDNHSSEDIFQARRFLEYTFYKVSTIRSEENIRELKNNAFDNMNSNMESYWFGVFDALRWVLGDEVEGFENV